LFNRERLRLGRIIIGKEKGMKAVHRRESSPSTSGLGKACSPYIKDECGSLSCGIYRSNLKYIKSFT
jgi:hypothetical protein